jgi:hypothetical protein
MCSPRVMLVALWGFSFGCGRSGDSVDDSACSVDAIGLRLAGPTALQCGSFNIAAMRDPRLSEGIDCALSSQATNFPFSMKIVVMGVDTGTVYFFLRDQSGNSIQLSQPYSPVFRPFGVFSRPCAGFARDVQQLPLACVLSGNESQLCVKH